MYSPMCKVGEVQTVRVWCVCEVTGGGGVKERKGGGLLGQACATLYKSFSSLQSINLFQVYKVTNIGVYKQS